MLSTQQLQEQADQLRELIQRLSMEHARETDVIVKFKLEGQLTDKEAELAEVEAQLKRRKSEPPSAPNAAPTATIRRIELTLDPRMNLENEFKKFENIAVGEDTHTRLILAHGASGSGKTHLLNLYRTILNAYGRDYLNFELKEEGKTLVENCLRHIVTHFGALCFPQYRACIAQPKNMMEMSQWENNLTHNFFIDLEECASPSPLFLLFDSYNPTLTESSSKAWLTDVFLPYLNPRLPLIVIIAGQEEITPQPKLKRCCQSVPLKPLELDHFLSFARAHQVEIDEAIIAALYKTSRGLPKFFAELVTNLVADRGGAR